MVKSTVNLINGFICDLTITVYDEPYCQGNSNKIDKSHETLASLGSATTSLQGPIRSMSHPGSTRVDIYSDPFFQNNAFRSRNDKAPETKKQIEEQGGESLNTICVSWRAGDNDPAEEMAQESLKLTVNHPCYTN